VAELLAGDYSPSGRLSFSYPATPGHLVPDHHKPSEKSTARWPFGHGLSYGTYEYSDLRLSRAQLRPGQTLTATVNVGLKDGQFGEEPVLWYVTDEYGRITRPVKRLAGYQRVAPMLGESVAVSLTLTPERDLAYPDEKGQAVLESGSYVLRVGPLEAPFELLTE
jgi:beta-glucosidase